MLKNYIFIWLIELIRICLSTYNTSITYSIWSTATPNTPCASFPCEGLITDPIIPSGQLSNFINYPNLTLGVYQYENYQEGSFSAILSFPSQLPHLNTIYAYYLEWKTFDVESAYLGCYDYICFGDYTCEYFGAPGTLLCGTSPPAPSHYYVNNTEIKIKWFTDYIVTRNGWSIFIHFYHCGNGILEEPGETCDDGNNINGDGCSANCLSIENGYECFIFNSTMSKCNLKCSNGRLDVGEACDDGNLEDNDGCSIDCVTIEPGWECPTPGSPCNLICSNGVLNTGEYCDDGNLINNDGCTDECVTEPTWLCETPGAPCTPSLCGNSFIDQGETCDDGNSLPHDGCSEYCLIEKGWICSPDEVPSICSLACGNGYVEFDEICDDGNRISGDGCSSDCSQVEPGYTCVNNPLPDKSYCYRSCGNGVIDIHNEVCDDGNNEGGDGCSSNCDEIELGYICPLPNWPCVRLCGNGVLDDPEECDDGNLLSGDGCSDSCLVEPGFKCHTDYDNTRGLSCHIACGDGFLDVHISRGIVKPEQCDDGNRDPKDGCSETCEIETNWVCPFSPGDACTRCGNGIIDVGEECDDGNSINDDGCDNTYCQIESHIWFCLHPGVPCLTRCGNSVVDTYDPMKPSENQLLVQSEICDDGNRISGDGCSSTCDEIERGYLCPDNIHCHYACGNGMIDKGEICDDGNVNPHDGCNQYCDEIEPNHFKCLTPGEPCIFHPVYMRCAEMRESCYRHFYKSNYLTRSSLNINYIYQFEIILLFQSHNDNDTFIIGRNILDDIVGEDRVNFFNKNLKYVVKSSVSGFEFNATCLENCVIYGKNNVIDSPIYWKYMTNDQYVYFNISLSYCGDGVLDERNGEECDDGNNLLNDGCNDQCHIENNWNCVYREGYIFSDSLCVKDSKILLWSASGIIQHGMEMIESNVNIENGLFVMSIHLPIEVIVYNLPFDEYVRFEPKSIFYIKPNKSNISIHIQQISCGDGRISIGEDCDGGGGCSEDCLSVLPFWWCYGPNHCIDYSFFDPIMNFCTIIKNETCIIPINSTYFYIKFINSNSLSNIYHSYYTVISIINTNRSIINLITNQEYLSPVDLWPNTNYSIMSINEEEFILGFKLNDFYPICIYNCLFFKEVNNSYKDYMMENTIYPENTLYTENSLFLENSLILYTFDFQYSYQNLPIEIILKFSRMTMVVFNSNMTWSYCPFNSTLEWLCDENLFEVFYHQDILNFIEYSIDSYRLFNFIYFIPIKDAIIEEEYAICHNVIFSTNNEYFLKRRFLSTLNNRLKYLIYFNTLYYTPFCHLFYLAPRSHYILYEENIEIPSGYCSGYFCSLWKFSQITSILSLNIYIDDDDDLKRGIKNISFNLKFNKIERIRFTTSETKLCAINCLNKICLMTNDYSHCNFTIGVFKSRAFIFNLTNLINNKVDINIHFARDEMMILNNPSPNIQCISDECNYALNNSVSFNSIPPVFYEEKGILVREVNSPMVFKSSFFNDHGRSLLENPLLYIDSTNCHFVYINSISLCLIYTGFSEEVTIAVINAPVQLFFHSIQNSLEIKWTNKHCLLYANRTCGFTCGGNTVPIGRMIWSTNPYPFNLRCGHILETSRIAGQDVNSAINNDNNNDIHNAINKDNNEDVVNYEMATSIWINLTENSTNSLLTDPTLCTRSPSVISRICLSFCQYNSPFIIDHVHLSNKAFLINQTNSNTNILLTCTAYSKINISIDEIQNYTIVRTIIPTYNNQFNQIGLQYLNIDFVESIDLPSSIVSPRVFLIIFTCLLGLMIIYVYFIYIPKYKFIHRFDRFDVIVDSIR